MPRALLGQVIGGPGEPDHTAVVSFDPIQHLVEGGPLSNSRKLSRHVLLQGLPLSFRPPLQSRVYVVRKVSDKQICHCLQNARARVGPVTLTPAESTP